MNTTQTPAGTFTRTRCAEGFIVSHESGDSEHVLTLAAVEKWIATYTAACEPIVVTGDVNGFFKAAAAEAAEKMANMNAEVVQGEIVSEVSEIEPLSAFGLMRDDQTRTANHNRQTSNHVDECFVCGRGLTQNAVDNGRWVEFTTTGQVIPWGAESDDSQGCFPVGSECAKKIPAKYKGKISK